MNSLLQPESIALRAAGTGHPHGLRLIRRAAALALLAMTLAAHAQSELDEGFNKGFDEEVQPWDELSVPLPPAPQAKNLVSFYVSPLATLSFAIDTASIRVDSDGVVRYTLVATSPQGARNVSYEGIRCQTFENKLYAFGQPDGSWVSSRHGRWKTIHGYAPNRPQDALAKDYFCRELTIAGSAEDIVQRIRNKQPLSPQRGTQ